ncbi:MAG: TldD/PmbA family protein [Pseudobacteriovorax sp.]|nr:TldD/PmbA family protein [Pseudobacteriovorax sp.]
MVLFDRKSLDGIKTPAAYWNVRFQARRDESLEVRQGVVEPPTGSEDFGVMVTVFHKGGQGYCATSDLSLSGLQAAFDEALEWAKVSSQKSITEFSGELHSIYKGQYESPYVIDWLTQNLSQKLERLRAASETLRVDPRIVDWSASCVGTLTEMMFVSSTGSENLQTTRHLSPNLSATAFENNDTEVRSLHRSGITRQVGAELLDQIQLDTIGSTIGEEAIELLLSPNCPTQKLDLLLDADQMLLQIHESIGHPIELDRILGDERNYAGTSFVSKDMFGTYQYGSELLNVSFDPTYSGETASYGFDDEGMKTEKTMLIEKGILKRGLGGALSSSRIGVDGVACSRACSWNRPPIDRMANLNLEPGQSTMGEMIANIELGVLMKTNCSWSIDDSRNKFQFGCEYGRMIRNGELKEVVRKPNYRGISADFWRDLKMVGNASTMDAFGTPYCGKGEPNQAINVGHASPACVFSNVQVFGGE